MRHDHPAVVVYCGHRRQEVAHVRDVVRLPPGFVEKVPERCTALPRVVDIEVLRVDRSRHTVNALEQRWS